MGMEIVIAIVLGLLVVVIFALMTMFGWAVGAYNSMNQLKQNVITQFGNVRAEYQRRFDLIPKLAKVVKSMKTHEKDLLTEVIKARSGILGAKDKAQTMKGMQRLDKVMALS